jgi:hypothetical protein
MALSVRCARKSVFVVAMCPHPFACLTPIKPQVGLKPQMGSKWVGAIKNPGYPTFRK